MDRNSYTTTSASHCIAEAGIRLPLNSADFKKSRSSSGYNAKNGRSAAGSGDFHRAASLIPLVSKMSGMCLFSYHLVYSSSGSSSFLLILLLTNRKPGFGPGACLSTPAIVEWSNNEGCHKILEQRSAANATTTQFEGRVPGNA